MIRAEAVSKDSSWIPPVGIIVLFILYICFAVNAFYWQSMLADFSPWVGYFGGYWLVSALLFFVRFRLVWVLLKAVAYFHAWLWAFSIMMSLSLVLGMSPLPTDSLVALIVIYLSQVATIVVLLGARGYLNEPAGRTYFGVPLLTER